MMKKLANTFVCLWLHEGYTSLQCTSSRQHSISIRTTSKCVASFGSWRDATTQKSVDARGNAWLYAPTNF